MEASIIICTRDRAESLAETLTSLVAALREEPNTLEVSVVDNASQDQTATVVQGFRGQLPHLQYTRCDRGGQSAARNVGLSQAQGEIIAFTDDDVRFQPGWWRALTAALRADEDGAVAGQVTIPAYLDQPWMTTMHRSWLASTETLTVSSCSRLVGANMAFARKWLERVPQFDEALGPGALGYGDDTLFSYQLQRAGAKLHFAEAATVEHHFCPSRLDPAFFFAAAGKQGSSQAYIAHHWRHEPSPSLLKVALAKLRLRLLGYRPGGDFVPNERLLGLLAYQRFLQERRRLRHEPRHYEKLGLVPRAT